eukprot:scaffold37193_cov75-Phaeocystis_antarctica.AAC.2
MHARQRKASGALALGVLGALAQLQELLVVRGRLLEVVVVLELLVRQAELVVRLPLLGAVAAPGRRLKALFSYSQRPRQVTGRLRLRRHRLVGHNEVLIGLLLDACVVVRLRQSQQLLVEPHGRGHLAKLLLRFAQRARGLGLALHV